VPPASITAYLPSNAPKSNNVGAKLRANAEKSPFIHPEFAFIRAGFAFVPVEFDLVG
jgi:hypothetical protein